MLTTARSSLLLEVGVAERVTERLGRPFKKKTKIKSDHTANGHGRDHVMQRILMTVMAISGRSWDGICLRPLLWILAWSRQAITPSLLLPLSSSEVLPFACLVSLPLCPPCLHACYPSCALDAREYRGRHFFKDTLEIRQLLKISLSLFNYLFCRLPLMLLGSVKLFCLLCYRDAQNE